MNDFQQTPTNSSAYWLTQLNSLGGKHTPKGGRFHAYDIDNCVQETAKAMGSQESCYGYVMGKLSALSAQNPNEAAISKISGAEVMDFCSRVRDRSTLAFYQNLCSKKSEAYENAFKLQQTTNFNIGN
jgi:hypothetical protein